MTFCISVYCGQHKHGDYGAGRERYGGQLLGGYGARGVCLSGYNGGGGGSDEETHQANVLINDDRTLLLSDFGGPKPFDHRSSTSAVGARYMAPKLITAESKADYNDDACNRTLKNQAPPSLTKEPDVVALSIYWRELDMADGYSAHLLWRIGVGNRQCCYKGFPPVTG